MRAAKTPTGVRREQIAEAALALLGKADGSEPSIAEIARRVGVVPSAVYRHYRGKDAILEAVLERVEGRLQESVALAERDTGDALGRLRGLFLRHAGILASNPGIPEVLLRRGVFGRSRDRRRRVGGVLLGYLRTVEGVIRAGQGTGELRRDVEPSTAVLVFLGMLIPAVVMRELSDGAFDIEAHARKAWPALEAALRAAPAVSARSRPGGRRKPGCARTP